MEFNETKYKREYNKEHYKQFKASLPKDFKDELDDLLEKAAISKPKFIFMAKEKLEGDLFMKAKIVKIEKMIGEIIDNAIDNYVAKWDTTNSSGNMSRSDWEDGCKGTIRGFDGKIINYIYYRDFKDLYYNFKYDLEGANDEVLDRIIEYLDEEKRYTDYEDLDQHNYDISDFVDLVKNEKELENL